MADRLWRAQVTIPLESGVPEDATVNTWHFDDDDDVVNEPEDTGNAILSLLNIFYDTIGPTVFPNSIGDDAVVKMYDLAAAEPRQPVFEGTFSLQNNAGSPMVAEAALCLSFAAAQESGVPAGRRRGRIFLGPIVTTAGEVVNGQVRPKLTTQQVVASAANELQAGLVHPGTGPLRLRWSIFSPTTLAQTGSIGASFNDVISGWVDDAFDTQRRRGPRPMSRVTFTAA